MVDWNAAINSLTKNLNATLGNTRGGDDPYANQRFNPVDPYAGQRFTPTDPYANQNFNARDPFANENPAAQAYFMGVQQENRGKQFVAQREANQQAAAQKEKQAATTNKSTNAATGSTSGGNDAAARWRPFIEEASAEYGIDPDRLQAIISVESEGVPDAVSKQGALGLGQVMPMHLTPEERENWKDPRTNIRAAARVLHEKYLANGRNWDAATAGYLGWGGPDAMGTTWDVYIQKVREREANIKRTKVSTPTPAAGNIGSAPIGQEFGVVSPDIDQRIYEYGRDFGVSGHTGVDYSFTYGTPIATPVGGRVLIAGGSGVYRNGDRNAPDGPGMGELRLQLDNGDELILGHMSGIDVQVGQRIEAGQVIGRSGDAASPHVHVEYRTPDRSMPSGWRIVDPRTRINFTGGTPLPAGHYQGDGHAH